MTLCPSCAEEHDQKGDSMDERVQALEERVAQLEEVVVRLTAGVAVHDTGVSVRAPLRVILPDGRLLAEIAAEPLPRVHVFNPQGNLAVSLGVFANGAPYGGGLAVYDHAGKRVGHLNVETYGARLILGSSGDNGGVVLFGGDVAEENGGGLHLVHRNGELGISLWTQPTGGALVIAHPERPLEGNSVRIAGDDVEGFLELNDEHGKPLVVLPEEESGR